MPTQNAVVLRLLLENGLTKGWDLVIVVDAPDEVRLQRLTELRGLAEADVRARMASQASREERNAAADVVIDNSGSLADLTEQVQKVWPRLSGRH